MEKQLIVKCVDNCSAMSIDKFKDESEYFITFYRAYNQSSVFTRIKEGFKYIFKGGGLLSNDIILDEPSFEAIKRF